MTASEQWKPVPEWEGFYEVSDQGRARSLDRMARTHHDGWRLACGRILKPHKNPRGYLYVNFTQPGRPRKTFQVHVAVMLAFAGPCPEGKQIRHLNGVPDDNRWAPGDDEEQIIAAGGNLVYGTAKKNAEDRDERHGTNHELNVTHCPQGHEYTEENTYVAPNGWRQCRICRDGGRPAPECREDGCSKPAKSRERCATHYAQWRRANMTDEQRQKIRDKDAAAGREKRRRLKEGADSGE